MSMPAISPAALCRRPPPLPGVASVAALHPQFMAAFARMRAAQLPSGYPLEDESTPAFRAWRRKADRAFELAERVASAKAVDLDEVMLKFQAMGFMEGYVAKAEEFPNWKPREARTATEAFGFILSLRDDLEALRAAGGRHA